ncbi:glycoside hydrolase family 38 protein [Pluteus cervinus]|uniref:Glycoside hydrolase family 38 protein n=1 Tax=Pluteus cervinus TaxID=181527 RepID=A0ACD3AR60_9AGAR|nr:glycoside hydrolase family 38 protein [Pluteus cervinus]
MAHHHHHHGHHHGPPQPPQNPVGNSGSYPQLNFGPGNKWIKGLTRDRLNNFEGGHFSDVNLTSVLFTHRLDGPEFVKLQVWSAPGRTKPGFEEADVWTNIEGRGSRLDHPGYVKARFLPRNGRSYFLFSQTNHWWKVTLTIPGYWQQYERVQFEFDPGCEAMLYTVDGTPIQGITGGYGGDRRVDYIVPLEARQQGIHELIIESSCNGMFGVPWNGDTIQPPDMNKFFSLASADLVVPNQEAWRLLWDFNTLKQIIDTVPGNTPLQNKALVVANEIMNVFEKGDASAVRQARVLAEGVFGEGWDQKADKIYDDGAQNSLIWGIVVLSTHFINVAQLYIKHHSCHIDTAWLWPYSVTQQKVARSWSTQVDLMERYPEHRFAASSAQQYKWLEQLYPPLYERVADKVKEGKFHPVGGAWVEHDANMPSGEALVRQFLYGQRYFESRFGIRCETAWLPDSFGLTGAFPQLIRGAGMKYFFTQKLSWNNINVFPHSTFNWVGIDGSQVLCHMTPVDTYTAQATVGDVMKGLTNHKNVESSDKALLVFGNGDGGGGPLNKMLENLRRIRAVNNNFRELPPINMGHSVEDFFGVLEKDTKGGTTLPNWHGELYLEFHRGTYTSHGSIKKGNRHSEILLRDVEHIATIASLQDPSYAYPKKRIDDAWEKVLLNQFHDVLPGSAIGMVYDDAENLYAEVRVEGEKILQEAFEVIFPSSLPFELASPYPFCSLSSPFTRPSTTPQLTFTFKYPNTDIIAYNTTFFPRMNIVKVPLTNASAALKGSVMQTCEDRKSGYVVMRCDGGAGTGMVSHPGMGMGVTMGGSGRSVTGRMEGLQEVLMPVSVWSNGSDHFVLRNASVQLTISNGRISSLLDVKLNRELIVAGETGGLVIFEDHPNYWDAWDVEIHHLETARPLSFTNISVVAQGPLRASVQADLVYDKSTISVLISLDAVGASVKDDSRSLFTFDARVDWRQRHQFLKFELPLNIHSPYATYETQFGHLQRPTHKNTTWDTAKFEVCGHKFADYSEYGYGVAILSESKYGFSCRGNVLRISLLRAATAPDADQDQGEHTFSWAVMPHVGHFLSSDVPIAAYLFNSPLILRSITNHPNGGQEFWPLDQPFVVEGATNVFLETIKRGEDDTFPEPPAPSPSPPEEPDEGDSDSGSDESPPSSPITSPTPSTLDHSSAAPEQGATKVEVTPKEKVFSVVLRLYEAYGGHASARLKVHLGPGVYKVAATNLLEDEIQDLAFAPSGKSEKDSGKSKKDVASRKSGVINLEFRAFEVKTVKIWWKDPENRRQSWVSVDDHTVLM